ncbi:hypothetical protein BDZ45DRAFT_693398 [Acephala macrosclerotiorum]|nr:hypothetical protein BDZ45DRAFT_693398 [Acephala macrosclerotiorum]
MSTYDRPFYHARSNVVSTAYTKSTAIPKERKVTFASEWHFYPLGVAVVLKRFEAFLEENHLTASCEWDEQTHSFRLRCRAEDSSQVSAGFYEVVHGVIKQELKKGFKGKGSPYPNGDDDDDDESDVTAHASRLPDDDDATVPEDELEELELDVSEALNSDLIRRLALWEQEHRSIADQGVATTTPASSSSTVAEEVYPLPIKTYKFQFKWLSCANRPSRLQKVAPDGVLEELRRLTGCDFEKQVNKGILYIGSNNEESMNVAIHKLDNLTKNRKNFYCVNHFFYSEGLGKVKFALVPFSKVKKFYFATTILDNLHIILNGGLDRKAGELPSDWQTLADAVTTRCAYWDQKNGVFDLLKRVEISVISNAGSDVNFKEWASFKYSAKGEEFDDPRRHYSSQPTTEAHPRQLLPSNSHSGTQGSYPASSAQVSNSLVRHQNGYASQPLAPPATTSQINCNTQNTLRVEQWAVGVNPNGGGAFTSASGENHVEEVKPAWDTYEEHNLNQLLRTKKEKPAQASSTLYNNISAMKRSTSIGFAPIRKGDEPPMARQSKTIPRSVSHPHNLQPTTGTEIFHESASKSAHSALADITSTSLVDLGIPFPTKEGRPVDSQFSESFLEHFKPHTLLDDDVSMVGLPVLEPARQGESNTSWTPMQPVKHQSAAADIDEPLISFSPILQPVAHTANEKLLANFAPLELNPEAQRGTVMEAGENTKVQEKAKQHNGEECQDGPSALSETQDTLSQTQSRSILDQIARDALLAAELQREEQGPNSLVDALLAAQYQHDINHPYPTGDAELAAQLQREEEQSINFNQAAISAISATSVGGRDAEKVQEDDEISSRTYHQTMNQKAGRGNYQAKQPHYQNGARRLPVPDPIRARIPAKNEQGLEDPVPEFVAGVTENFSGFMTAIRPFRGQIVLQAEFGRIIMRNFAPSNYFHKSGDEMFKEHDLRTLLLKPTEEGPFCSFTNVLTLLPADMQYLVKIKDKKGNPLWHPTSIWNVTYEFHFRDTTAFDSPFFLVEVDGETFKTEVKVRRELGSIYCHGTMRHWDFRIAATGYESSRDIKGKYGAVRAAVENTLYIPPDMKAPFLLWEMGTALSNRFQLQELQVKRVLKYQSEDRRSSLNVTEIQSLDIQGSEVPGKPISVFQAAPGPNDGPPTEKLRQWWEASISSTDADQVLEENKTLELGDEPGWTAETLSKVHVASALYLPACEMLKKMDGVGFLNRNGIERAVVEASKIVPKDKKSKVVDQAGFW